MCFYLFVFFLIFYSTDFTHVFMCFYLLYVFVYFNFGNFSLFFVIKNINQQQNLKQINLFFKKLLLLIQNSYRQYNSVLY